MSEKFKVGDRVVVVEDTIGTDYWTGRRGRVDEISDLSLPISVLFDDDATACFTPDELELEEVYDTLSSPGQVEKGPDEDAVSHPSHYTSHPSGVECIEITKHYNFCIGSAIKYLWRHLDKHEDPIPDLLKAIQFIQFEIERLGGTV